jgi:hypothetical protein
VAEEAGTVVTQDNVPVQATVASKQPDENQQPRQGWWQRLVR